MISIDQIRQRFSNIPEEIAPDNLHSPTAVALLLRMGSDGPSVLFIERAFNEHDPWSGNIGFPGGRMDTGDSDLRHTAERETMEEVGISLVDAKMLGRLPDIVGANLPVRVACFVYLLESVGPLDLNAEVNDAFWVPLSVLTDPARQLTATVSFAGNTLEASAIKLPLPDKAVLWGITYRLIRQFIAIATGGTDLLPKGVEDV
jgi:8-oxo-dGTP pyrophosphatase MutT (NUDIX family)